VVIGLAAGPALAVAPWTIRPGGAVTLGPAAATIKDTTTAATITCTGATLTGKLKSGCFGLVASGDPVSLTASFTLAPAQSITSP
jgi:hypothetical protein